VGKKRKKTNPGFGKCFSIFIYQKSQKSNKRPMTGTIVGKTKREGQTKAKIRTTRRNQRKEGRELIPLVKHIPRVPGELL
jgi:hypothetical protein